METISWYELKKRVGKRYFYMLPVKNGKSFKVGETDNFYERYKNIHYHHDFKVKNAVVVCHNIEDLSIEGRILNKYSSHRIKNKKKGVTEFFPNILFNDIYKELLKYKKFFDIKIYTII